LSDRIPVLLELKKNGTRDDQALGRSRGGFSTKLHALVDGLGNGMIAPTRRHCWTDGRFRVIAYRGYAGQAVLNQVLAQGAEVVIPPH
jgi:hypothetical protein